MPRFHGTKVSIFFLRAKLGAGMFVRLYAIFFQELKFYSCGGDVGSSCEHRCHSGKARCVFGCKIAACGATGYSAVDFGMTQQVIGKRCSYDFSLVHNAHFFRDITSYFSDKQGIVGATQNKGVDVGTERHEVLEVAAHEPIGAVAVGFAVFDKRNPHWTRLAVDVQLRMQFADLDVVGA